MFGHRRVPRYSAIFAFIFACFLFGESSSVMLRKSKSTGEPQQLSTSSLPTASSSLGSVVNAKILADRKVESFFKPIDGHRMVIATAEQNRILEDQVEELNDLERENQEASETLARTTAGIETLKGTLQQLDEKDEELSRRLSAVQASKKDTAAQMALAEEEREALITAVRVTQERNDLMKSDMEQKQRQAMALKETVDTNTARLSEMLAEAEADAVRMQSEQERLTSELGMVEAEKRTIDGLVKEREEQVIQYRQYIEDCVLKVKKKKDIEKQQKKSERHMTTAIEAAKTEMDELKKSMDTLRKAEAEFNETLAEIKSKMTTKENDPETQSNFEDLKLEVAKLTAFKKTIEQKIRELPPIPGVDASSQASSGEEDEEGEERFRELITSVSQTMGEEQCATLFQGVSTNSADVNFVGVIDEMKKGADCMKAMFEAIKKALEAAKAKSEDITQKQREKDEQFREVQRTVESGKETLAKTETAIGDLSLEVTGLTGVIKTIDGQRKRLETESAQLGEESESLESAIAQIQANITQFLEEIATVEAKAASFEEKSRERETAFRTQMKELRSTFEAARAENERLSAEVLKMDTECETLVKLLQGHKESLGIDNGGEGGCAGWNATVVDCEANTVEKCTEGESMKYCIVDGEKCKWFKFTLYTQKQALIHRGIDMAEVEGKFGVKKQTDIRTRLSLLDDDIEDLEDLPEERADVEVVPMGEPTMAIAAGVGAELVHTGLNGEVEVTFEGRSVLFNHNEFGCDLQSRCEEQDILNDWRGRYPRQGVRCVPEGYNVFAPLPGQDSSWCVEREGDMPCLDQAALPASKELIQDFATFIQNTFEGKEDSYHCAVIGSVRGDETKPIGDFYEGLSGMCRAKFVAEAVKKMMKDDAGLETFRKHHEGGRLCAIPADKFSSRPESVIRCGEYLCASSRLTSCPPDACDEQDSSTNSCSSGVIGALGNTRGLTTPKNLEITIDRGNKKCCCTDGFSVIEYVKGLSPPPSQEEEEEDTGTSSHSRPVVQEEEEEEEDTVTSSPPSPVVEPSGKVKEEVARIERSMEGRKVRRSKKDG